ncbi:hypothetical protein K7G98_39670, partial [Saccharothrix sp. MB29]|nr:hypothetical protein [Saccharothrix sp. MB29]
AFDARSGRPRLVMGGNWEKSRCLRITGTYRGQKVTHHLNPYTDNNVMLGSDGMLVGSWHLGDVQLNSVLMAGRLF